MSNEQNPMVQVLSIIERLAANPNSNLTATNVTQVIDSVHETVMKGYKKVAEFQASTSLSTADRSTAETPRTETATTVTAEVAAPTQTISAPVAPVISAPKAAAKATDVEIVKSPAPKQAKKEEQPAKVEETVAEVEETVAEVEETVADIEETVADVEETVAEPDQTLDEDRMVVASMIEEHGSAVAALAVLEANRKRGRKAAWHKLIEAKADEERRAAPMKSAMVDPQALAEALKSGKTAEEVSQEQTGYKFAHISRVPIMDPEKAIGKQMITCLIDGVARTMMSRYLKSDHNMTPKEYIAHFGLRPDYPMTSPTYREEKRRLAAVQKLGKRKPESVKQTTTATAEKAATAGSTNRRTRTRKAA
jgi:predicted transcriptional regulator